MGDSDARAWPQPVTVHTGTTAYEHTAFVRDIHQTWDQVRAIEESAWSGDGWVTVSVGVRGELRTLVIDPRVYRVADAAALARSIRDTIAEAGRLARSRAFDVMKPLLPRDADAADADLEFGPLLHYLATEGRRHG